MKRYSSSKEINALVGQLIRNGWLFRRGGVHGKLSPPNGGCVGVPSTPSDRRAYLNFRQNVRRVLSRPRI